MPDRARRDTHSETRVVNQRAKRQSARDIAGEFPRGFDGAGVPVPEDAKRRKRLERRPDLWLRWYMPTAFYRPFSKGQRAEIDLMARVLKHGGCYAIAAPRKDGKTTRVIGMSSYGICTGARRFIVPVGATGGAALEMLDAIKLQFRTNDRLHADYPEYCVPARVADDNSQRARGQTCNGRNLEFKWTREFIVLPTWPGIPAAVLKPTGLTGRIRGMIQALPSGEVLRPDMFLLDDPQDDESANSPSQCRTRENLIRGAVLGAGGDEEVAAIMPCTIIRQGDLAARFLDHEQHPEFRGSIRALLPVMPDDYKARFEEY